MQLLAFRQDAFAKIVADFQAFARRTGIDDVRFVPMSALEGDMVVDRGLRLPWYDGPTLLQILETAEVPTALARAPLRFPVQYVSRPTATLARGYMGRIESGAVAVGDRVIALPSGLATTVREIRTFDGPRARAGLHARDAVLADALDISRGDMLVAEHAAPASTRHLDATVCWLADAPLDPRRSFLLRHTTREVRAGVVRIDHLWNTTTHRRFQHRPSSRATTSAISR
jgi:sulfate adenylyltransferase subunit 1